MTDQSDPIAYHPLRGLRIDEVETFVGLKTSSIYKYSADPDHPFPSPVRVGANTSVWLLGEIANFMARSPARNFKHKGPRILQVTPQQSVELDVLIAEQEAAG